LIYFSTVVTKTELPYNWNNPAPMWSDERVQSITAIMNQNPEPDYWADEEMYKILDEYVDLVSIGAVQFLLGKNRLSALDSRRFIVGLSVAEKIKPYTTGAVPSSDMLAPLPPVREALRLSEADIEKAEELTRSNVHGKNWYILRHGRCMASLMGKVRFASRVKKSNRDLFLTMKWRLRIDKKLKHAPTLA
jgi:hypothetical protein